MEVGAVVYGMAAVLTALALAAFCGWWRTRRALTGERAARHISEAALLREFRAITDTAAAEAAVSQAADAVLDAALAQHYQHNTEGDPDA